jgi:hypothetical protein
MSFRSSVLFVERFGVVSPLGRYGAVVECFNILSHFRLCQKLKSNLLNRTCSVLQITL